jgi:hypothetical protein
MTAPRYAWGKTSMSRLDTCHPLLIELFDRVIRRPDLPHDLTVVYGHRSHAEQAELYAKGRRGIPGERVVTYARPGQSKHNASPSQAVDVVPFIGGKPSPADWVPFRAVAPFVRAEWAAMQAEGRVPAVVTLHWGGDWNGPPDAAHWEVRGVT